MRKEHTYRLGIIEGLKSMGIKADIFQLIGPIDVITVLVPEAADIEKVQVLFNSYLRKSSQVAVIPFYRGIDIKREVRWHEVINSKMMPNDGEYHGKLTEKYETLTAVYKMIDWETYKKENKDDSTFIGRSAKFMEGISDENRVKKMRDVSEVTARDVN